MRTALDLSLDDKLALAKASPSINLLEQEIAKYPAVDMPVGHIFTPGLYVRTIFMPAGTILTSRIHKTEHPFVVHKGRCVVYIEGHGAYEIVAPHFGITRAGTRRALHIVEDTYWTTFHPTQKTTVEEVEAEIIEPHEIPEQVRP